ncbi:M48 family metallopeptidase [Roseateles sp. BYS87W]|uniref:M48 family metallopeptidase n=1 Tax=Pelomonas baiyunensis TaxID=3299026 RepID=A0ABW7GUY4_9BURK
MTSPHLASPGVAARYLAGYPPDLVAQADALHRDGRLAQHLARRLPERHDVRSDSALFEYVNDLKGRHLRNAGPLNFVGFDAKLRVLQQALGTHTRRTQVQGAKLKMRREIRVATLFKEAPAALLRMIVVHELAHLRELDHNKAFYQLCQHMEPEYFQLEFDLRLYLLHQDHPVAEGAP